MAYDLDRLTDKLRATDREAEEHHKELASVEAKASRYQSVLKQVAAERDNATRQLADLKRLAKLIADAMRTAQADRDEDFLQAFAGLLRGELAHAVQVAVQVAVQPFAAAVTTLTEELVESRSPRIRRVVRDERGAISHIVEENNDPEQEGEPTNE